MKRESRAWLSFFPVWKDHHGVLPRARRCLESTPLLGYTFDPLCCIIRARAKERSRKIAHSFPPRRLRIWWMCDARFLRTYYPWYRTHNVIIIVSGRKTNWGHYCSLESPCIRIFKTTFPLFRLTNDAVAESWLVRGYRDTRGKLKLIIILKLCDRSIEIRNLVSIAQFRRTFKSLIE